MNNGGFALKGFVNLKEVLHLLHGVAGQLRNIEIAGAGGIVQRHGDNFFVGRAAVGHLYNADGAALHKRHGLNCFAAKNEYIKRVAVGGIG